MCRKCGILRYLSCLLTLSAPSLQVVLHPPPLLKGPRPPLVPLSNCKAPAFTELPLRYVRSWIGECAVWTIAQSVSRRVGRVKLSVDLRVRREGSRADSLGVSRAVRDTSSVASLLSASPARQWSAVRLSCRALRTPPAGRVLARSCTQPRPYHGTPP